MPAIENGGQQDDWQLCQVSFSHRQMCALSEYFERHDSGISDCCPVNLASFGKAVLVIHKDFQPTAETVELALRRVLDLAPEEKLPEHVNYEQFLSFCMVFGHQERIRNPRTMFSKNTVGNFEKVFQRFNKRREDGSETGLQTNAMFQLWSALGRDKEIETQEQKEKMIRRIKEVDADLSGTIDFEEFLQLVRLYQTEKDAESRSYIEENIAKSRFVPREVEELREVFAMYDDQGTKELHPSVIRQIMKDLGVKLDKKTTERLLETVDTVMANADNNDDGLIDVGEFMIIMRELIDRDFAGIREAIGMGKA
mmetsp:Transcript_116877/g.268192  ORF Transcript_116877/g.268192 Transcript_116877/m.268192 type:complete len:311 (-) Transcript_116877:62-994(-)